MSRNIFAEKNSLYVCLIGAISLTLKHNIASFILFLDKAGYVFRYVRRFKEEIIKRKDKLLEVLAKS